MALKGCLQPVLRGKGTRFTAILRRSQFNLCCGPDVQQGQKIDGPPSACQSQPVLMKRNPLTVTSLGQPRLWTLNKHGYHAIPIQQLSGEAETAGHAAHGSRHQMIQITVGWRRQLPEETLFYGSLLRRKVYGTEISLQRGRNGGRSRVLQTCLIMPSHISSLLSWKAVMQTQMSQETSELHPLRSTRPACYRALSKLQPGRSVRKQMS